MKRKMSDKQRKAMFSKLNKPKSSISSIIKNIQTKRLTDKQIKEEKRIIKLQSKLKQKGETLQEERNLDELRLAKEKLKFNLQKEKEEIKSLKQKNPSTFQKALDRVGSGAKAVSIKSGEVMRSNRTKKVGKSISKGFKKLWKEL